MAMRGQEDTYGMGAGASVRKGKVNKQVKKARKNINAAANKTSTKFAGNAERIDAMLKNKKAKGVSKGTYKSGGLYSSGRAIVQAPGTKKKKP